MLQNYTSTLGCSKIGARQDLGQPGFPLKVASRLVPDAWLESEISGCMCHFRTFQLELDNVGNKKFKIGSVVKKLQPYSEVFYKIFYKIFSVTDIDIFKINCYIITVYFK